MADIREQDLALKTTIADTDWMRLVTPTGNHRMTVGQFKDLIGYTQLQTDVSALKNDVADYVVEQGTNYTKWASGKLEQIITKYVDIPVGTAWANIYYHDFSLGNWEIPFSTITYAKAHIRNTTYWSNIHAYSTTSSGTIRAFRPTPGEGPGIAVIVEGVGRWK